ncbi:hypothetical protein HMPREF9946_00320 [Acetobacteraceae bacterium AT-5844]|nr:hypothetical protein HMPREF9946_00320 [Acetobacteraceae bacterium AT-5844]
MLTPPEDGKGPALHESLALVSTYFKPPLMPGRGGGSARGAVDVPANALGRACGRVHRITDGGTGIVDAAAGALGRAFIAGGEWYQQAEDHQGLQSEMTHSGSP